MSNRKPVQIANVGFQDITPQIPPHDPPPVEPLAKSNKPSYGVVATGNSLQPYPAPPPESPLMRTGGEGSINTERVTLSVRMRFNPLRNLSPDRLSGYLDQFDLGFFRQAAVVWDRLERRDPTLKAVIPKRKKAVARHGWEILTVDNIPAGQESLAQQQIEALSHFYNNLTAVDAVRPDQSGGMPLLVRQMMDAHSKYYAVHEIVWQPKAGGLSAQFVFCPLWWFEGVTGKLRYLDNEFQVYGRDMNPAEWLVTVGEGYMESCCVAWMYKNLSLHDWVAMSEKFGTPFIDAATSAAPGSDEWEALIAYVQNFSSDGGGVRSNNAQINLIKPESSSVDVFKTMIEHMDRALTILWRGGDLGTSSKQDATGASLQGDESDILESDDTAMIEETLDAQVSRFVLAWSFGPDAPRLAYLKFRQSEQQNVDNDLKIDQFLLDNGAPVEIKTTLERYGRAMPSARAQLLTKPQPPALSAQNGVVRDEVAGQEENPDASEMANEGMALPALEESAREHFAAGVAADLQPLRERLAALLQIQDDNHFAQRVKDFTTELEGLQSDMLALPKCAQVLAETQIAALFNGIAEGVKTHKSELSKRHEN